MKLTLTREQIPLAWETVAWLRDASPETTLNAACPLHDTIPGYQEWLDDDIGQRSDDLWADALEAAITEAEGTQAPQLGPVSDADERAFWREVFTSVHDDDKRSVATAADQADEALKRYRAAFGGAK